MTGRLEWQLLHRAMSPGGKQTASLDETWKIGETLYRIRAVVDSHADQCYAKAIRLGETEVVLALVSGEEAQTFNAYRVTPSPDLFGTERFVETLEADAANRFVPIKDEAVDRRAPSEIRRIAIEGARPATRPEPES